MQRMTVIKIGDRIKLISTDNPYTRLKPGDSGVVWDITTFESSNEETKQIWIRWDDGGSLALIEGKDEWEIIVSESKQVDIAVKILTLVVGMRFAFA